MGHTQEWDPAGVHGSPPPLAKQRPPGISGGGAAGGGWVRTAYQGGARSVRSRAFICLWVLELQGRQTIPSEFSRKAWNLPLSAASPPSPRRSHPSSGALRTHGCACPKRTHSSPLPTASSLCPLPSWKDPAIDWVFMPGTGVTMTLPKPSPLIIRQLPVLGERPLEPSSDQPLFSLSPLWPKPRRQSFLQSCQHLQPPWSTHHVAARHQTLHPLS